MNIIGYVRRNKNKSFLDLPFSEVDSLIFCELSYVDFQLVAPKLTDDKEDKFIALKDLPLDKMDEMNRRCVDDKRNKSLLKMMMRSARYGEVKVGLAMETFSKELSNQFAAFTFLLPTGLAYIAYRGTDTSLIGWKEDFFLTFMKVTLSQKQASEYLNSVIPIINSPFYLGGHSKGGNHAIYAALNMPPEKTYLLREAHNFDGPDFKEGIEQFPLFTELDKKLVKYMTHKSVIGAFYNNSKNPIIVPSRAFLFGGHDPFGWRVDKLRPHFIHFRHRSKGSVYNERAFFLWEEKVPDDDKEMAVNFLFDVFQYDDIYRFIRHIPFALARVRKALQSYEKEDRQRLIHFFITYIRCLKEVRKKKRPKKAVEN